MTVTSAEPAGSSEPSRRLTISDATVVEGKRPRGLRIAAAGDIACDPESGSFNGGRGEALECRQRATSDLIIGAGYRAVLALGDLQYEDGELSEFRASYDPSWGRVKAITHPVPGNHEYETEGAAGYYRYFGAAAGGRRRATTASISVAGT